MSGSKLSNSSAKPVPVDTESVASVTPMKGAKECTGPKPGTAEYVQAQMNQRGITANPIELVSEIGQKRPASGTAVKLIVVTVFDNSGEKNHLPTAVFISGDMFAVKEHIKQCDTAETVVNDMPIPAVQYGHPAKFTSNSLMKSQAALAPVECRTFANFLREECEQSWMVLAVPPLEGAHLRHMAAVVDTRVDLLEYAHAWKRALLGKPLHYDTVNIVNYFVSDHEVPYLATMYAAKDASYGRRRL